MIVLGISPLDHDATVALLVDGEVVCAVAEERLSRISHHAGFPWQALETVLRLEHIETRDVDRVAYASCAPGRGQRQWYREVSIDWQLNRQSREPLLSQSIASARAERPVRDWQIVPGLPSADVTASAPSWKQKLYQWASQDGLVGDVTNAWQLGQRLRRAAWQRRQNQKELVEGLCEFGLADKLVCVEQQAAHAANAYYGSGFDRALVVTLDAGAAGDSLTVEIGSAAGLQRIDSLPIHTSLATWCGAVASALGCDPRSELGKVVDLAAFGDEDVLSNVFRAQVVWEGHRPRFRRSSDVCLSRRLAGEFAKIDLAAAFQAVLEEIVVRYVAHYLAQSGLTHIVLSGSLAVNAKLVQRVHEMPGVQRVYVHPNMAEGGCGVGAAQLVARRLGDHPCSLPSAYLGPDYSARQLHGELVKAELPTIWYEDIEEETARLLADDYVVARFAGRLEYGPRALGNRSILCAAKNPDTTQSLNDRLRRPQFIPFSPATLAEDASRCYQYVTGGELAARFMTIAFDCTPWMRQNSPAAVHIDGTARPQLVTSEVNPSFHRILAEYKRLTGLPTIINTRFHLPGEPLVCSPHDAIRAFLAGGADYLAMGNYLIPSPQLRNSSRASSQTQPVAAQSKRPVTPPLS